MLQIKVFYLFILAAAPAATLPLPTDPFSSYALSATHEEHMEGFLKDHPHQEDPFEAFLNGRGGTSHHGQPSSQDSSRSASPAMDQGETHHSEHSQASSALQSPTNSAPSPNEHQNIDTHHQHQAPHPSASSNMPPHVEHENIHHQPPLAATSHHPSIDRPPATPQHPSTSSNTPPHVELDTHHQPPATPPHPSTSSNMHQEHSGMGSSSEPAGPSTGSQPRLGSVVGAVMASQHSNLPPHSEPQKTDTSAHHQPPASPSSSGPSTGGPPNHPNPDTLGGQATSGTSTNKGKERAHPEPQNTPPPTEHHGSNLGPSSPPGPGVIGPSRYKGGNIHFTSVVDAVMASQPSQQGSTGNKRPHDGTTVAGSGPSKKPRSDDIVTCTAKNEMNDGICGARILQKNMNGHLKSTQGVHQSTYDTSIKCPYCTDGYPYQHLVRDHVAIVHPEKYASYAAAVKAKKKEKKP